MAQTQEQSLKAAELKIVPISYLKKGDRFTATRKTMTYGASNSVIRVSSGVADMDGHAVSESYGLRQGNTFFLDPERNYINVKWDGVSYGPNWVHPNDGIYEQDGFTFYVTEEVAKRVKDDIALNEQTAYEGRMAAAESVQAKKKRDLLAQVAVLQKQINEL